MSNKYYENRAGYQFAESLISRILAGEIPKFYMGNGDQRIEVPPPQPWSALIELVKKSKPYPRNIRYIGDGT